MSMNSNVRTSRVRALSVRAFVGRFVAALIVCSIIAVVSVGTAFTIASNKVHDIRTVAIDDDVLSGGRNFLLIGSDTRAFIDDAADEEHFGSADVQTGQRSDTLMIAHVEPGNRGGYLVSIPRDLWVDIPGVGPSRINAAFNDGPQKVIETVQQNFDIPIAHYLEIDFAGFRDVVDALGSIPIYFPAPARDANTGLDVAEPGCHALAGDQALAYVRSRYYEYFENGEWHQDPTSDLGRIRRQQYFVRTLAHEAANAAVRKPWRANDLADALFSSLTRDPKLEFADMRGLARALRGTEDQALEVETLPTTPENIDGQAVLRLDDAKAVPILARLRAQDAYEPPAPPPNLAPSSVSVGVRNATDRGGLGASTLEAFKNFGFAVVAPAENGTLDDPGTTEIRYSGDDGPARLVAAYLRGAGKLIPVEANEGGADVVVVLGEDFSEVAAPASTTTPTTGATGGTATTPTSTPPAPSEKPFPAVGCIGAPT
jgi:LCP family protein required for cell wall assembly